MFSLGTSLSASWSQCQKSLGGPGFEVETFWLTSLKFASGSAKSICAHSRALFRGTYSTSQKSHGFPVLSHPPSAELGTLGAGTPVTSQHRGSSCRGFSAFCDVCSSCTLSSPDAVIPTHVLPELARPQDRPLSTFAQLR